MKENLNGKGKRQKKEKRARKRTESKRDGRNGRKWVVYNTMHTVFEVCNILGGWNANVEGNFFELTKP